MNDSPIELYEPISPEGLESIELGLADLRHGRLLLDHNHPDATIEYLELIWSHPDEDVWIAFSFEPSDWSVSFTDQFRKDIAKIDAKLRGRILSAISEISEKPDTPKGNTIHPLTADLKGLWRYRIGDFRLVYANDAEERQVTLIAFAGRGDVYKP